MKLDFFLWHRRKPVISVIYGEMKLSQPMQYICPLCGKTAFETYYNIKTHYWGEKKKNGIEPINKIQCKNGKCKALFIIYKGV
jgi:hypothetical protein